MKLNLEAKSVKVTLRILFVVYAAMLIGVIFLKFGTGMTMEMLSEPKLPMDSRWAHINIIPFKTIYHYLTECTNPFLATGNLFGNIIAFGPLGFLLPLLFNKLRKLLNITAASFIVSLSFELIQIIGSIGEFDVDDIILNVLGAVLGFAVHKIFIYLLKKYKVLALETVLE